MRAEIVIIGRPNVGKSTLFNRLVGKRLALVDDQPGVTRDRRMGDATLFDLNFTVVDTAGYEDEDAASLPGRMRRQTEAAAQGALAVLFVIDARAGVTPLDAEIGQWLRTVDTPKFLLANKAEGRAGDQGMLEAYELGLGEPIAISAEHGLGLADLHEVLAPLFPDPDAEEELDPDALAPVVTDVTVEGDVEEDEGPVEDLSQLKLAIVGRPNAGKSTLVNAFLGEDRMITGPEAGITRDSIAIDWSWTDAKGRDRPVRLIDTAGMRKKARVTEKLEKLSVADARRAVDFAEVVVLLLDATKGLEHQDLKIASMVIEEGRGLIIALNKWDVAEDASRLFNGVKGALEDGLSQVKGVPLLAVSARTGKGLDTLVKAAFELRDTWSRRVPTSALNRWFDDALAANPPPAPGGKRIKLRFITQAKSRPPGFVLFGSRLDMLPASYVRYLVNSIRRDLGFNGVPVRFILRGSTSPYGKTKRG